MPSPTLYKLLENIRSDKSTQRHEGLKNLREFFAQERIVKSLDERGDGRAWVVIFQALFAAVLKEKEICLKKGLDRASDTAVKKLNTVSETLRWLAERVNTRLTNKCVKPLIQHCLEITVHRRKLLMPVAFPSLQILRVVLSYPPHRDHIKSEAWLEIFSLAFAILIEDDISTYFTMEEDEEWEVEEMAFDDKMEVDASTDPAEDDTDLPEYSGRKRGRSAASPTPGSRAKNLPRARARHVALSREQICAAEIINLLLSSPYAVFECKGLPRLTRAILNKFLRFLEMFPQLTTAHHHIIHGIILTLTHAEMNCHADVVCFGKRAWSILLSLWQKKDNVVKEGLVMIFTILLPFVTQAHLTNLEYDELQKLQNLLTAEVELSVQNKGLTLADLRLGVDASTMSEQPYHMRTFKSNVTFSAKQAHYWSVLELQADCLTKMVALVSSFKSESRGKKRARREDPLMSLTSNIITENTSSIHRVARLQMLLFYLELHYDPIEPLSLHTLVADLIGEASGSGIDVQSWALMCLTSLASRHEVSSRGKERRPDWEGAWKLALHLSTSVHTSRAACHLGYVLMTTRNVDLPGLQILKDVDAFIRDLSVRGPSFPYDSVCRFLGQCLYTTSRDVRLSRKHLDEMILWWLSDRWKSISGSNVGGSRSDSRIHFIPDDMLWLLATIAGFGSSPEVFTPRFELAGFLPTIIEQRTKQKVILNYMLHSQLPPFRSKQQPRGDRSEVTLDHRGEDGLHQGPQHQVVENTLLKLVEAELEHLQLFEDVPRELSAQRLHITLNLAVVSLLFEALVVYKCRSSNVTLVKSACSLISRLLPILFLPQWSVAEQLLLVQGFLPLVTEKFNGNRVKWRAMLNPSKKSGIKYNVVHQSGGDARPATKPLLSKLWQIPEVAACFTDQFSVFRKILTDISEEKALSTLSGSGGSDADLFGSFVVAGGNQTGIGLSKLSSHIATVLLRLLFRIPFYQSPDAKPIGDHLTFRILDSCSGQTLLVIGSSFVEEASLGYLHSEKTYWSALHAVLDPAITSYSTAKDENIQFLVIDFVRTTLTFWLNFIEDSEVLFSGLDLCHSLARRLAVDNIRSWRIRDSVSRLLCEYLSVDPREERWSMLEDSSAPRPSELLLRFASDEDTRVRFSAATICATFIATASERGEDSARCYTAIHRDLPTNIDAPEVMLTRALLLGNAMTASSDVRRGSYWHLIELPVIERKFTRHVQIILESTVIQMGLHGIRDLFDCYQYQIAFSIDGMGKTLLAIPPQLLGFEDENDCAIHTYKTMIPVLLVHTGSDRDNDPHRITRFKEICRVLHKPTGDAYIESYAELVGRQIVFLASSYLEQHDRLDIEEVHRTASFYVSNFGKVTDCQSTKLPQPPDLLDRIILSMFRMISDTDYSERGSIARALEEYTGKSSASAHTFKLLNTFRVNTDFLMHTPTTPFAEARAVLQALNVLQKFTVEIEDPKVVYHVMRTFFAEIDRSPSINEQLRLYQAMCIWITINAHLMVDGVLLRTLMHGSLILMSQVDLTHCAQSMFAWGLTLLDKQLMGNNFIQSAFIAVGQLASEFGEARAGSIHANLSLELFEWIEAEASRFIEHASFSEEVVRALCTWPRPLPEALSRVCTPQTRLDSLQGAIRNSLPFVSKHKFFRQIGDPLTTTSFNHQWNETDLWSIKRSIPTTQKLSFVDASGLARILFDCSDRALSRPEDLLTISQKYQKSLRNQKIENRSPKPVIVSHLVQMLYDSSYRKVNLAYQTLRSLLGTRTAGFDLKDLHENRDESSYLASYPLSQTSVSYRSLSELEKLVGRDVSPFDYNAWIKATSALLASYMSQFDSFYGQLEYILSHNESFAGEMLPVLVHQCLVSGQPEASRNALSSFFSEILSRFKRAKATVASVIDAVLYLRHFSKSGSPLEYNRWLDVEFLALARGAISSCAFTTALMFIELSYDFAENVSYPADNGSVEEMLYEIYDHIQEPDGFYGIQNKDAYHSLIRRYEHEQQWENASRMLGAQFEVDSLRADALDGIINSLHLRGFHKQASLILEAMNPSTHIESSSPMSMSYNLGWRTGTWDLPIHNRYQSSDVRLYEVLRSIHCERNDLVLNQVCSDALVEEVSQLGQIANEDLFQLEECAQRVLCLKEINDWIERMPPLLKPRQQAGDSVRQFQTLKGNTRFKLFEKIMSTRLSLLQSVFKRGKIEQLGKLQSPFAISVNGMQHDCLSKLAVSARESGDLQVALNYVVRARAIEASCSVSITEEFANVLWLQNEQKVAVDLLRDLGQSILQRTCIESNRQRGRLLARIGEWSAEARLEKSTDILEKYFNPAVELISDEAQSDHDRRLVFEKYALFSHRQYLAISSSPELARLNLYMERKKGEIRLLEESIKNVKTSRGSSFGTVSEAELEQHMSRAKKLLDDDESQADTHNAAKDMFLRQAIDMYSRSLCSSGHSDTELAIRLCSLWYANFDDVSYGVTIDEAIARIPSHKFVFLAHQLTARLSDPVPRETGSLRTLRNLVVRLCEEHPFHILPQIFSLRQTDVKADRSFHRRSQSSVSSMDQSQAGRQKAALDIFNRVGKQGRASQRVKDVETLCSASLEWATYTISKNDKGGIIPHGLAIRRIQDLKVPIITTELPVDISLRYDNVVFVNRYSSSYTTAGGISVPKICECVGSDAKRYKQLFKGQGDDDMRQDAVMEQVFQLMNVLLKKDRETKQRNLHVRTYKVVPLSMQAGVIEYVQKSEPLGDWLLKAHISYEPGDMNPNQASKALAKARETFKVKKDRKILVEAFLWIRRQLKPVMRHFFTERFKTPVDWFSTRLNYSRSVAVASIAGHVLGLGDRHVRNILLDKSTGEVVHIDLGIAFEQGKLLPVPETIPFRLTADMVDGFGSSKSEGVFRRCAEHTLRVLRENSEIILTVLDVFKYDPLYNWTINPVKKLRLQEEQQRVPVTPISETGTIISNMGGMGTGALGDVKNDPVDDSCDRALGSVSRKLDKNLSIEYTVNELIVAAMDVSNLACLYHGWSPHL